jgi:hypothetical protein
MSFCARCGQQDTLTQCDGRGYVVVDAENNLVKECPRLYLKRLTDHITDQVGVEVVKVKHVKNSPLHVLGKPGEPVISDLTLKNIYIQGTYWGAFLAHLKWALVCKGTTFTCRRVTDLYLLDVYLGKYRQRQVSKREEVDNYNQLDDLVGEKDLVIIRLGQLGYKNVAAPGVLKETLMIRANLNLPTWLVDDPRDPWSLSKDFTVEEYVNKHFEKITLEDADPGIDIRGGIACDQEDYNEYGSVEEVLEEPKKRPKPAYQQQSLVSSDNDDLSLPGNGSNSRKKFGYNKRKSSGGPV